jgi:cell division protein FtsW (lipid II flippase)
MLGLLLLVAEAVLGAVTHGAKLSYSIGGVSFQPSEFVKILFVFFVAGMFKESKSFIQVMITTIVAALHILTLVLSKDLGSALIFFVTYLVMLYVATRKIYYLLAGGACGALAAFIAYKLFSHIQIRIIAWQDPWNHINDEGYQITQSLFAIGTGGWYGMGIYQGNPTAIPYVEQDFVFSAVAEELGVIFAICLILVCVSCFLSIMLVAMRLKEEFYRYIAVGIGMIYITQVFLTIGGGTRFIPLTGVTLPLVSYGGSSVLATIIMFCIVQGLYCVREQEGIRHAKKAKRRKASAQERIEEE